MGENKIADHDFVRHFIIIALMKLKNNKINAFGGGKRSLVVFSTAIIVGRGPWIAVILEHSP